MWRQGLRVAAVGVRGGVCGNAAVPRILQANTAVSACGQTGMARQLHAGAAVRGLEEFFPPGPAYDHAEAGRAWCPRDLRLKSNTDLHKLWYVLIKERNMLLTVAQAAKQEQVRMPAPERMRKVRKGLRSIKVVLGERERAAQAAAAEDPVQWISYRERLPAQMLDSGIRPKIGSEKAGRVARARPRFDDTARSATDEKQLLGVPKPQAARHHPRYTRPMTKPERAKFRAELNARREAICIAEQEAIQSRIKTMSDDDLMVLVREGETDLREGWDDDELRHEVLAALKEAKQRPTTFTVWETDVDEYPEDYDGPKPTIRGE